ncbi:MAG: TetR/AcrR family transcriptional regulator [Sneathiella sp.]
MPDTKSTKITIERPALQLRSQEKRRRLVKAGFQIFARDGYKDARIADIAKESGISVGAFYHRFGDKRGFFQVLLIEYTNRGKENWELFFKYADLNWSAAELFDKLVAGEARAIDRNMGFFSAYLSLGRKDTALAAPMKEMDRHGANLLLEHLRARSKSPLDLDLETVHFAINSIGKILVISSVMEGSKFKAQDPTTIREVALMIRRYLAIE